MAVVEEKGWWPQIEFEGKLYLAKIGDKEFIPDDIEPEFNFNFANNPTDKISLNYHVGLIWESAEEAFYYGFMVNQQIGQRFTGFIEHYGFIRGDFAGEGHFAAGIMYLVTNDLQLDLMGNYGFDDWGTFLFVECGVSVRLAKGKSRTPVSRN